MREPLLPDKVLKLFSPSHGRPIGQGSFKSVFAGKMLETGEDAVVTVERFKKRYDAVQQPHQTEKEVLKRIRDRPHPNLIMSKADPVEEHDCLYILLDRCEQEVFDLLKVEMLKGDGYGALSEIEARKLFVQCTAALLHMHEQLGVAHMDVKLENMMIAQDGTLKLIDFGLAHCATSGQDWYLMSDEGSKRYSAPEVRQAARLRKWYDTRAADVWSLGVCLFVLTTGFIPLEEATNKDWRFQRLSWAQSCDPPESTVKAIHGWYQRDVSLSPDLVQLLDRMLCIDPTRRPTLSELLSAQWIRVAAEAYEPLRAYMQQHVPQPELVRAIPTGANHSSERREEEEEATEEASSSCSCCSMELPADERHQNDSKTPTNHAGPEEGSHSRVPAAHETRDVAPPSDLFTHLSLQLHLVDVDATVGEKFKGATLELRLL